MIELAKSLAVTAAAICLAILGCEIAARLWDGIPVFKLANFRYEHLADVKNTVTYDPVLGWRLRDNLDRPDLLTVSYGIRRGAADQTGIRPNAVLAVGASVTQGYGVADSETWPAQLERQLGEPVDNAAVVGYAIDQMVLRVEQLLPVEKPRAVLLGAGTANVQWVGSTTVAGAAKPFFTVEDGSLRAHNIPVPQEGWQNTAAEATKDALGYFHLADRAMSVLDPIGWRPPLFDRAGTADPEDVSCRLLDRLQQELAAQNVRAFLVALPRWSEVVAAQPPREFVSMEDCAQKRGYRVIDILGPFKKDRDTDAAQAANDYSADLLGGHLSEAGNRRVAELVAAVLTNERQLGRLP